MNNVIVASNYVDCKDRKPLTLDCSACGTEIRMHPNGGDVPKCCDAASQETVSIRGNS